MASQRPALPIGFLLGACEVEVCLGVGGMGAVYRARDRRLGRVVAVKVLPPSFVASPERRQRFEREARILGSLNHPHICALYDVGREGELDYLIMEHVEGVTLAALLKLRRLQLGEVLSQASQIAAALAYAHTRSIVHRDLKPANVMITPEGLVKVLDFGLAKAVTIDGKLESAPTLAEDSLTSDGVVVGTFPYLSPEQAAGEPVDGRSDIFSFGTVLYEMLTGVRVFGRPTNRATLQAVLTEEPRPLRELAPGVPEELDRIVERCLRKDRERRLRSMADLSLSLRELEETSLFGSRAYPRASGRRGGSRRRVVWGMGLTALVLSGGVLAWQIRRAAPTGLTSGAVSSYKVKPVTSYRGNQRHPSLSPEGRQVAFSWDGEAGSNFDIYVKPTASGPPLRLTTDPAEDFGPAWSPDGETIAFLRARREGPFALLTIPALGGPERKLGEVSIPDRGWGSTPFIAWFPDGQSFVVTDTPAAGPAALFRVSARTGTKAQLTFPLAGVLGDTGPAVSPDGRQLAFGRMGQIGDWSWSLNLVPLTDPQPSTKVRPLTAEHKDREANLVLGGIAWCADSRRLLYSAGNSLWMLSVDSAAAVAPAATKLEIGGRITDPTLARESNRLVFAEGFGGEQDIWRAHLPKADRRPEPGARFIASSRFEFAQRYSPDGRRIAFQSDRGGNFEIWVCANDGSSCSQLTEMKSAFTGTPAWSPDGRQVAYYSRINGAARIFVIGHEGGGYREIAAGGSSNMFPAWSHDGRWIYFSSNRSGRNEVWKVPAQGGAALQVTRSGGFASAESLDGRWLYFTRSEAADAGLFRMALPQGEATPVVPSLAYHNFHVVGDGIYFVAKAEKALSLSFYSFATGTARPVAPLPEGYVGLSVSPDREWVLYTGNNESGSTLSLVEGFR